MGGRKRLDRVLEGLVPASVDVKMQRIRAFEGGLVVAVDDDVVVPRLLHIQTGLHDPVEEKLRLAKMQEVRPKAADDVFSDLRRHLQKDPAGDERT